MVLFGKMSLRRLSNVGVASALAVGAWLFCEGVWYQIFRLKQVARLGFGFNDPFCALPFCDFPLFWEAGHLARLRGPLYDSATFAAATSQAMSPHIDLLPFPYPPPTLLLAGLMSLPPVAVGYYIFSAVSLVLGIVLLRFAGLNWKIIAVGCVSFPAMWNLYLGQLGFLCTALLVCGLMQIDRRPMLSGALLAGLCIKPQYALLIPVVVLASRNYRALASGGFVLGLLVVFSALFYGLHVWPEFFGPGRATIRTLLEAPFQPGYEYLGASVFWLARSFGANVAPAYGFQLGVILIAAVLCWMLWRRPGNDLSASLRASCEAIHLSFRGMKKMDCSTSLAMTVDGSRAKSVDISRLILTVCLILIADPHAYTDDLIGYALILPLLIRRETPVTNAVIAGLWIAPAFSVRFVEWFGFLPMPFCIAIVLIIALRRFEDGSLFSHIRPKANYSANVVS